MKTIMPPYLDKSVKCKISVIQNVPFVIPTVFIAFVFTEKIGRMKFPKN